MDKQRARFILQSHRPGTGSVTDADVAEALALTRQDPELRAWFEEEQRLDAALRRKLRAAPPPPDLLGSIVAGFPAATTLQPRQRWARRLALAASIAVLATAGALLWQRGSAPEPGSLAAFHADMGTFLKSFPRLDLYTEKHSAVREWLASKLIFNAGQLPAGLEKFPAIGCREFDWRGQRAALVCFMVDGEVIHLVLLPKQSWTTASNSAAPLLGRSGRFSTATWASDGITYVALTRASQEFLRTHLTHRAG